MVQKHAVFVSGPSATSLHPLRLPGMSLGGMTMGAHNGPHANLSQDTVVYELHEEPIWTSLHMLNSVELPLESRWAVV